MTSRGDSVERARDVDALALAPGNLVRIAVAKVFRCRKPTCATIRRATVRALCPLHHAPSAEAIDSSIVRRGFERSVAVLKHHLHCRGAFA